MILATVVLRFYPLEMHHHKWFPKIFSWGTNIFWIGKKWYPAAFFHHMFSHLFRLQFFFSVFFSLKSCNLHEVKGWSLGSANANQDSCTASKLQLLTYHYGTLLNIGSCFSLVPYWYCLSVGFWIAMGYIINLNHENMSTASKGKCFILWWYIWIINLARNFSLTYQEVFWLGILKI